MATEGSTEARRHLPVFPGASVVPLPASGAQADDGRPLVDPQERKIDYLRVSLTDRCNYRCGYCLPEDVEHAEAEDLLEADELAALVTSFVRVGVRRVRLTGGEPTVRRGLTALVRRLREISGLEELSLSTNGERLAELALPLREAGVDRLNVSLDSLDPGRFRRITGRGDLSNVLAGLDAARAAGFTGIKTNAVVLRGENDGEVGALCAYAWERGFVPRFIEPMPMAAGSLYRPEQLVPAAAIRDAVAAAFPGRLVTADPERGGKARGAGPARYFRVEDAAGMNRFGIISAMTEHFCTDCNRVRLSSTGELHACLAHDDAVDLRAALHGGGADGVAAAIRAAVAKKRDGHLFELGGGGGPRKAMIQIGG